MASVEEPNPTRLSSTKSVGYSRILTRPNNLLITDIRKEINDRNRPCNFFGVQLKAVASPNNSPPAPISQCGVATKRAPPVPPRPGKTTPSPGGFKDTSPQPPKKRTPPPVPKKQSNLRLAGAQSSPERKTTASQRHVNVRLFALLLSPTIPTPITDAIPDYQRGLSSSNTRLQCRPLTAFGSTPHLDRILKDSGNLAVKKICDFDDNNNSWDNASGICTKNEQKLDQAPASRPLRPRSRAARRKSLPLLAGGGAPAIDICNKLDNRSGATSRCSSSFGAEQGSVHSSLNATLSSPPPVPVKDYIGTNSESMVQRSLCSTAKTEGQHPAHKGLEESDSVIFFSTVSTVSSYAHSGDRLVENQPIGDGQLEDSDKARMSHKRCSRLSERCSKTNAAKSNTLLNAFAIEQSRRTVSIIERNARIIKWLYGCANSK